MRLPVEAMLYRWASEYPCATLNERVRSLREYVETDIRQHRAFVVQLADLLCETGRVAGETIQQLWFDYSGSI